MTSSCLRPRPGGVELDLRVLPNAPATRPDGYWNGPDGPRLRLRVKAPPVEGKANDAVLDWAAKTFSVRRADVRISRGAKGREKTISIEGLALESAQSVLASLA